MMGEYSPHQSQFQNAHFRDDIEFFTMLTHLSIDETIQPTWIGLEGAVTYMADAHTSAWDELC